MKQLQPSFTQDSTQLLEKYKTEQENHPKGETGRTAGTAVIGV